MDRPLPHIGPIMIGSDRVSRVGENVVIEARELIDWPLREFCKSPIFFEE